MNFVVDAQLPPALARWIAARGHNAAHVFDIVMLKAIDPPVALIWVRMGNCSNRALLAWFEPLWPDVLKRLEQGERFIELRE